MLRAKYLCPHRKHISLRVHCGNMTCTVTDPRKRFGPVLTFQTATFGDPRPCPTLSRVKHLTHFELKSRILVLSASLSSPKPRRSPGTGHYGGTRGRTFPPVCPGAPEVWERGGEAHRYARWRHSDPGRNRAGAAADSGNDGAVGKIRNKLITAQTTWPTAENQ
ncbi:hypothetical protein NL108_017746 [Boleophthalmus pectinirostris]|nr:hypothetical protein NL108_017746 [Boleophthalmus pectinirostris]